jgi:hypothetical protein
MVVEIDLRSPWSVVIEWMMYLFSASGNFSKYLISRCDPLDPESIDTLEPLKVPPPFEK